MNEPEKFPVAEVMQQLNYVMDISEEMRRLNRLSEAFAAYRGNLYRLAETTGDRFYLSLLDNTQQDAALLLSRIGGVADALNRFEKDVGE